MILLLFFGFIVLILEAFSDVNKMLGGVSPPVSWGIRIALGVLSNGIYLYNYEPFYGWYWIELAWLNAFFFFYYWTFFDIAFNLFSGRNALAWGKTKFLDRLFGGYYFSGWIGSAFFGLGHFIKWSGLIGSFIIVVLPRIRGESPIFW